LDAEDALVEEPEEKPQTTGKGMRQTIERQNQEIAELKAQMRTMTGESQTTLNEANEESQAEIERLKTDAMNRAYASLDLNQESGIGRAAAQTYEGEADGLAQYVLDEYEYVYAPDNPAMPAITNGHAALDMIGQTAGSIPMNPTEGDEFAKA
jgi:hypothetical protein